MKSLLIYAVAVTFSATAYAQSAGSDWNDNWGFSSPGEKTFRLQYMLNEEAVRSGSFGEPNVHHHEHGNTYIERQTTSQSIGNQNVTSSETTIVCDGDSNCDAYTNIGVEQDNTESTQDATNNVNEQGDNINN